MRYSVLLVVLGLVAATAPVRADDARVAERDDDELSYVMVTEGIVGGFVPAHVRGRMVVVPRDDKFDLLVMKQPQRNDEVTYQKGTLTAEQFDELLAALDKAGVWKLPVESPPGCQDIYKKDTSIAIRGGDKFWRNGGPAGCVHGVSKIQPDKKQLETFGETVGLLKKLAEKHATDKGDAKSFNAALELVHRDAAKKQKGAPQGKPAVQFR